MTNQDPRKPTAGDDCPLTWPEQRRNLVLFAACTGMQYLAAPVLYVGITQASLCDRLGADARTANLPATLFFAMTAMPALFAWWRPQVRALKRNLLCCYGASALMLAATALVLASSASNSVKLAMVILQAGVSGAVMPAAIAFLWEAIRRGSAESRRGLALGLAFGVGPVLAVLGSLAQTALLGGNLFGYQFSGVPYPNGFITLFAAAAPVMGLASLFSQFLIVPPEENEPRRAPMSEVADLLLAIPLMFVAVALLHVAGVLEQESLRDAGQYSRYLGFLAAAGATAGLIWHFRAVFRQPVLLTATVVTVLVYCGNAIPSNLNLYSPEALGDSPEKFSGQQNMLRFGFKVVAGLFLGWLLMRTNPRTGILATAGIFLAAMVWAMFATGSWYLLAFGLYGAGELVGVYAPNYIVSASRRDELRRNTAFLTMLMAPAAPAGYLYGAVVDFAKTHHWTAWGLSSAAVGFRLSFLLCALLIATGILLAWLRLPKRPHAEIDQT